MYISIFLPHIRQSFIQKSWVQDSNVMTANRCDISRVIFSMLSAEKLERSDLHMCKFFHSALDGENIGLICRVAVLGRFPLTRSERSNYWMKHKTFGHIWPKNLDNIRMRSIFARYLRNRPDLSIDAETKIRIWPVRPLNGKAPLVPTNLYSYKYNLIIVDNIHTFDFKAIYLNMGS